MPGIERAVQLINQAKANGDEVLSINSRGLTNEDFESLIPIIARELPQLKELDLAENDIDTIPDAIAQLPALEVLNLEDNELESLPQVLAQMPNLKTLNLADNDIAEFPQVIMQMAVLEHADLSTNKIQNFSVPQEVLANLGDTTIDLTNNPLSDQSLAYINESVPDGNIETDLANPEEAQDVGEVLKAIYPENSEQVKNTIENLNFGEFTTAKLRARKKDASQVLSDFLSKTPNQGAIADQIYLPVTKRLLDTILDPATSRDDQINEIQKMATSLGNCSTPVKSFLIQNAVDQQLRNGEELTPLMENLLDREAVEDRITIALKDQLRDTEKIEQIQALVNSIFLEGSENHIDNKVQIVGERERLPSKTAYEADSFKFISEQQAAAFAPLFCETNGENELIKNSAGQYKLDPAKLKSVTSAYRAKLGLLSTEERAVQEKTTHYEAEVTPLLRHDNLMEHFDEPDVKELLDLPAQQEALRVALFRVPEEQRDSTYQQFLTDQKVKIQQATDKYEPKKKAGMKALIEPMNEGRRSPSPDAGGKRQASSPATAQSQQKRRKSL